MHSESGPFTSAGFLSRLNCDSCSLRLEWPALRITVSTVGRRGGARRGGTNKSIGCLGWVRSIPLDVVSVCEEWNGEGGRAKWKMKRKSWRGWGAEGRGTIWMRTTTGGQTANSKRQTTNAMLLPRPHAARIRLHFANTNTNAHLQRGVSAGGREGEGRVGIEPPLSRWCWSTFSNSCALCCTWQKVVSEVRRIFGCHCHWRCALLRFNEGI